GTEPDGLAVRRPEVGGRRLQPAAPQPRVLARQLVVADDDVAPFAAPDDELLARRRQRHAAARARSRPHLEVRALAAPEELVDHRARQLVRRLVRRRDGARRGARLEARAERPGDLQLVAVVERDPLSGAEALTAEARPDARSRVDDEHALALALESEVHAAHPPAAA